MSRGLRLAVLLLATMQVVGCTTEEACHRALNRFWEFEVWTIDPETEEERAARHDHARRLLHQCKDVTPWFNYGGGLGAPEGQYSISVFAIYLDDTELLDSLVSEGHPIDGLPNPYSDSSIAMAVAMRSDTVLDWLIDRDVDVNLADYEGMSPLAIAAGREGAAPHILPSLIAAGADINATNNVGRSALFFAVFYRQPENALFLLEHGAEAAPVRALLEADLKEGRSRTQREMTTERLDLLEQVLDGRED